MTPTKNYTVEEQKQLMLDNGDAGGVRLSRHVAGHAARAESWFDPRLGRD